MSRAALVLVGTLVLAGCAGILRDPAPLAADALELETTPFFPQRDHQCGPAALATVLGASGVEVHPDELVAATYLPERRGSLQVELVAAARRRDRLAVTVQGTPEAIVAQLQAGRPVLVLQNLGLDLWPVWHYAVVVGYQPEHDRFLLRSGGERRAVMRHHRFTSSWRRGGNWALVVLTADEAPTGLAPGNYLRAAADLENTGAHARALTAFETATRTWPEQANARLGVANNLYYLNRLDQAAAAYRELLARFPRHEVALHNLAMLLLEMDQPCAAASVLADAPDVPGSLMDTARRAVRDAAPPTCDAAT